MRGLEAGHRAALVAADLAVNLAGREIGPVQQYLRVQRRAGRDVRSCLLGNGLRQLGRRRYLREGGRAQQGQGEQGGAGYGHGGLRQMAALPCPERLRSPRESGLMPA
ncbi:hypothetical protein G6F63_016619 [Rhizopus arrhizus]|nr:hypothetical protein G6F63_016619 [Rhizopus arrhizus]